MSAIGKRLAEERKRLGYSQSAFADLVGISFSSQRRYEDGRSSPDTAYLEVLGKAGVDVNYVLFGIASDEIVDCPYVAAMPLPSGYVSEPITLTECRDMAAGVILRKVGHNEGIKQWFDYCQVCALHPGKLRANSGHEEADANLIATIVEGIESSLEQQHTALPPAKKGRVAAMLYRAFKASGKVDPAMIEEAVKLAAE